jgi:Tol biopolymer transport system component
MLPGTENAVMPFWSPNGEWVAFFGDGKLKKIPSSGGPAQVVLDGVPDPRGGSWGPDDTILFGNGATPIMRVSSTGGGSAGVTTFDVSREEVSHRWPVWLPDGRHFLFTARSRSTENSGVYVGAANERPKRLPIRSDNSVGYAWPGFVLYLDGETLFGQRWDESRLDLSGQPVVLAERVGVATNGLGAFSTSNTGELAYSGALSSSGRLTWFDRTGSQVGAVDTEGDYVDFRLSPDDKRLAASLVDPKTGNPDIWLTDLARGDRSRFTLGPRLNASPVWSPDSSRIVFRTTRSGGLVDFYEKSSASGGTEVPVLPMGLQRMVNPEALNIAVSDWSPDGRHLLYSVLTLSRSELWLLPLMDAQKPVTFISSQSENMHGTFSPNGRLVAYASNESGRFEVSVQTLPLTDRKWTVSTAGGYEPRWRGDGREIYFLSEDRKLMVASVEPGPSFGVPRPLFQTQVPPGVTANRNHYAPTRDGTRFLVNTESADARPVSITVVLNWLSGIGP